MKIFLRKRDLLDTEKLMILKSETEAQASIIRLAHDIMSDRLYFASMFLVAGVIFFLLTSFMITPWLFIPWAICFATYFVVLCLARNHGKQANSWFVYAMWKDQEEYQVQLLAEEHLAANNGFYSKVFSSPDKATEQHPFEVET